MQQFYRLETEKIPKDICMDLLKKGYISYDPYEAGKFYFTKKGNDIILEVLQNLANLG